MLPCPVHCSQVCRASNRSIIFYIARRCVRQRWPDRRHFTCSVPGTISMSPTMKPIVFIAPPGCCNKHTCRIRGRGARHPPPIREIFFGQLSCKLQNAGILLTFQTYISGQKYLAPMFSLGAQVDRRKRSALRYCGLTRDRQTRLTNQRAILPVPS